MPSKVSNDATTMIYAIDATGAVTGKLRRQQDGHNAAFQNSFENLKMLISKNLENNKIEIQKYSRTNQRTYFTSY
jgi:hypothetical protein